MVIVLFLIGAFMLLFIYCVCVVSSECSRIEEEFIFKEGLKKMDKENVYIIIDESFWDNDLDIKIIAVVEDESTAKKIYENYVEKLKNKMGINNQNPNESDKTYWEVDDYKVETDENYFSVYLDGYYSTNHTDIQLLEKKLTKEFDYEETENSLINN